MRRRITFAIVGTVIAALVIAGAGTFVLDRLSARETTRRELERRNGRRIHVDETERRVVRHQMSTAFLAVLSLANRRLLIHADVLASSRHFHGIGIPE